MGKRCLEMIDFRHHVMVDCVEVCLGGGGCFRKDFAHLHLHPLNSLVDGTEVCPVCHKCVRVVCVFALVCLCLYTYIYIYINIYIHIYIYI